MNCNDPNNPDAIWKLVPANRTIIRDYRKDASPAYVSAVTVCSQQLTIIESEQTNLLTMPTGSLEVTFYDGNKVKINVIFENKDSNADSIKIYRNTTQTLNGSIYVGSASSSENLFVDDLEDNGLYQTFYYYIQAISTSLNMVSRYRFLGSVSTYEIPNVLAALFSDEPENRVSDNIIWPITMGVPFTLGSINKDEDVVQVLLNNKILPSQQKQTLSWSDTSSKFLTIDFQATTNDLNLYDSGITLNNTEASHANPVISTDNTESIEINNGIISFNISKTSFKGIENLIHNGQEIINSSDFYWVNHDDEIFKAENFVSPAVTVETEGPIRTVIKAEGFFKHDSTESMKFRIRFHIFAGLPYIKIDYTWIWTENTFSNNICDFTAISNKVKLSPCRVVDVSNWANGQAVKFGQFSSSTMPTGLNTSTVYYVRNTGDEALSCGEGEVVNRATFTVHPTANDAINNTNIISLGTNGTGTFWISAHTPYIKDIALKFNTGFTINETNTEVDGVVNQYQTSAKIIQTAYDTVEISDNSVTENIGNIAGWVEGSNGTIGLACSMKYESTKQFMVNTNSLSAHIVAPDGPNFNWNWDANIQYPVVDSNAEIEHTGFCPSNPYGVAKTTEIWVWPTTTSTNNSGINDLIQNPPCVITDPTYNCDTDVINNIRPASETPESLQFIEDALELAITGTCQPTTIDFKMMDYGDIHLYRSGNWRNWDSGGHASGRGSLAQFYRTGKRIYKYLGEILHKHYVDVDIVNYSTEFNNAYSSPKTIGWNHIFSTLHWSWGPIFPSFTTHKESLIWAIGLLGNERFNESMADSVSTGTYLTGTAVSGPTTSREQYGPIEPMVAFYTYNYDQTTLDNVFSIFESVEQASSYTEVDGVIYNQQGQPVVPNNNFWYYYVIGLRNLYYNLDDQSKKDRIRDLVLKIVADYAVQHNDANDPMYWLRAYSSTYPNEPWVRGSVTPIVTPFTFAYETTGNENYLREPIKRIVNFALTTNQNGLASLNFEHNNNTIHNIIFCLGAWSNENYRLDLMHGGNNIITLQLPTSSNPPHTYVSTFYFRKEVGVESFIRIYDNLQLTTISTPIYYKITKPDFTFNIVQLTTTDDDITYYINPKVEITISNADYDGYDFTNSECKLEILSQVQNYYYVQSNLQKFVWNYPTEYYTIPSTFSNQPSNESDVIYIKKITGQTEINVINQGYKVAIFEEDENSVVDIDLVPTNSSSAIFNANGTINNISIQDNKLLKVITFGSTLSIDGAEPYCAVAKSRFFIPNLNTNKYYPLLTCQGNVFSDNSATIASVHNGVAAVWMDTSEYHNKWIQTDNTKRPIYKTSAINGYPALDFSGNKYLNREGSIHTSSGKGTIFVVFKVNAISGNQAIFSSYYNDASYETLSIDGTGGLNWSINSNGGALGRAITDSGVIAINTTCVITISANDATNSYIIRVNGVQVTVTGDPYFSGVFGINHIRFALGCFMYNNISSPIGDYFNGQIAEFRILNLFNLIDNPGKVLEEEQKLLDKYL